VGGGPIPGNLCPFPKIIGIIHSLAYEIALPTRARPSFPHSQSLPSGSLYELLIFTHQRADRLKTTMREN